MDNEELYNHDEQPDVEHQNENNTADAGNEVQKDGMPSFHPIKDAKEKIEKSNMMRMSKRLKHLGKGFFAFAMNPYTWIAILALVVGVGVVSVLQVVGRQNFGSVCDDNGVPIITSEDVSIADKKKSVASYYLDKGLPNEVSSALATLTLKYGEDYSKFRTGSPENTTCDKDCVNDKVAQGDGGKNSIENKICNNDCIEKVVNNNDKIGIGVLGLTGANAKGLISFAKEHNLDWGKPETQINYFGTVLSAQKENGELADLYKEENATNIVKLLSEKLGVEISNSDSEKIQQESNALASDNEKTIKSCKVLGDGSDKGRQAKASENAKSGKGSTISGGTHHSGGVAVPGGKGGDGGFDLAEINSRPGTSYPWGQCTWGVQQVAPWVGPYWGNGGQWADSGRAAGFETGDTPKVGSIVSWNSGVYGHVAYVIKVNSPTSIEVLEANFNVPGQAGGPLGNYRGEFNPYAVGMGNPTYIYPKS